MAQVILLCGKIAGGKTTFAKHMQKDNARLVVLSVDDCMRNCMDQCMGRAAHVRMEEGILRYFYELSIQLIQKGISVLIDHGYWEYAQRQAARDFYKQCGIEVQFHYFIVTEEEQSQRLRKRNQKVPTRLFDSIGFEKCRDLNRYFEAPDETEIKHHSIIVHDASDDQRQSHL